MPKCLKQTVNKMKMTYEESVKRLEEITKLLENGGVTLEESFKLFSEGTAIIAKCNEYLNSAETKIKKLFENGEINE